MCSLRRPLLVCAIAVGLGSVAATVRGESTPILQRSPTAHCNDGTYYYGPKNKRLACAHHRGVSEWLAASNPPSRQARAAARRRATVPRGATARCRDGTYSFVRNRAKACAEHRGITRWLRAR
jgi:hypothetical protein